MQSQQQQQQAADERTELDPAAVAAADYGALAGVVAVDANVVVNARTDSIASVDLTASGHDVERLPLNRVRILGDGPSSPTLNGDGRDHGNVSMATAASARPPDGAANGKSPRPPTLLDRFKSWLLKVGPSWLSNADVQMHRKLIVFAVSFCVFGLVLCATGIAFAVNPPHALYNLVFIIGGFVIFVPGIYYIVYVVRAYQGHEGYSFQDLPHMD